jgi:hexosaminidase
VNDLYPENYFMRTVLGLLLAAVTAMPAAAQRPLNLMPMPSSYQLGSGEFAITQTFEVKLAGYTEPRLEHAASDFMLRLGRQTGLVFYKAPANLAHPTLIVRTGQASLPVQELGEDESYKLEVTANGAEITAANPLGAMHGLQTFLQLVAASSNGFAAPVITIQDTPRFRWRGLMIDTSRHFMPLDVLRRNLDGMAAVKLNVFHWHLSDNQGFRVESKRFPKLQDMGSDGLYYTQDDVRGLIEYARERGIRVVPEFDVPGHSTAWFVGYPELASAPGPYQIERRWGIFDPAFDPTEERSYRFLDELFGEMTKLFPDKFFHIGGDEVNGKQWDANPKIQAYMKAHGIKNNEALQTMFTKRVQPVVAHHGKIMMGWDETLSPDLPKDTVIQSWRGQQSLADASRQGYRGLLSFGYYLDLMWPASQHYAVDPLAGGAAGLNDEQKDRILGGEACEWSEYASTENIDSRIWPRMAAIAERLWSPQQVTDVNSMYQRLDVISQWLNWIGLEHNTSYPLMLSRIAGQANVAVLRNLANVVEPVKDYWREKLAKEQPTLYTPLNRVIDAARPESDEARRFNSLVDARLAGDTSPEVDTQLRTLFGLWRDNPTRLRPLAQKSFLVNEVMPISEDLGALGTAGLAALDSLNGGKPVDAAWKSEQLTRISAAKQVRAQLLLMIAPGVEKLVKAAGSPSK